MDPEANGMRPGATVSVASVLGALLMLAAVARADAQPATFISFDSQAGDYIGGGRKFTLTPADGTFGVSRTSDQGVRVSFSGTGAWWYLYFAAPGPSPLVPGMYEAATRWPFQSPTEPGLDVSGEGRGCNRLTGRFVVLEAVYDGSGNVDRFAADYEQHCEGGAAALFGSVRYESAVSVGPRLSASSALVYEGDLGTRSLSVVVSLSAPAASPVTVQYRTEDGTATAGLDYVAASGTVVLAPGQTAATVPVSVLGDSEPEADETFFFVLEAPQGASLAFATGLETIVDDDPYKTFLTFDSQPGDYIGLGQHFTLTPVEGSITATRSANVVTVSFDGSTWWDLRFAAPSGGAIVPGVYEGATRWPFQSPTGPGLDVSGDGRGCNQLTGRFVVLEAVYDGLGNIDRFAADYEQHCEGGAPALFGSARYRSAVPVGPRLSVSAAAAYEGDFGTATIPVVVSLSAPVAAPVAVQYRTVDGTATAGVDYVAASGNAVFPPGQTAVTIPVSVLGDTAVEPDETFSVVLENPVGATVAFGAALATIVNDDPDKTLLMFDSQPGDWVGGGRRFTLTPTDGSITASVGGDNTVSVAFDGSTWWDLHFAAPDHGALVPGVYENATRWPFQAAGRPGLDVSGDGRGCNTLTGRFVVHEAVYDSGTVTRLAVDYEQHCEGGAPALFGWVRFHSSVALPGRVFAEGGTATEGPGAEIVFKVKLTAPSASPVTADYATVDGTAIGDEDYVRSYGSVFIPAGSLEATVAVSLIDDAFFEATESFGLEITGASGALVAGAPAVGTILDDDEAPVVSLGDVTVREGDPGRPGVARVPVTLDRPAGRALTLTYAAASGSAVQGQDFVAPAGFVVIAPDQTSATIDIDLVADLEPESEESFTVTLFWADGAQLGTSVGTVTVEDDDGPAGFYTIEPCRLLDSRLTAPPLRSGGAIVFRGAGVCGVPTTAKAVVLNITAVSPSGTGHFRLGPAGTPRPDTAVLNFVAGRTRGVGPAISLMGVSDALTLYAVMNGGSTHAVVDVFGYFE
jgi:hypothetical protein